jgi:hypothetical protein
VLRYRFTATDGSLQVLRLECHDSWDYIQLSTGWPHINNKVSESGIHNFLNFHVRSEEHYDPYRWPNEGLYTLRLRDSLGAITYYPLPNCRPGTRKAVRQIILNWIHTMRKFGIFFLVVLRTCWC